jgi:hypothetical protein
MRAADGGDQPVDGGRARPDGDTLARLRGRQARRQAQALCALSGDAAPNETERRRGNDAEHRDTVAYDRHVDGEFVAAGDEFPSPIERVDKS